MTDNNFVTLILPEGRKVKSYIRRRVLGQEAIMKTIMYQDKINLQLFFVKDLLV